MKDQELVRTYQHSHDTDALGTLYSRYYERVYRYCLTILKDREAAMDITQEVFLKVTEHLSGLKNPATFTCWLFRIAHNECMDYYKVSGKTTPIPPAFDENLAEEAEEAEQLLIREQRLDAIESLLQDLSEDARTMLQLKYLQKLSIQDLQRKFNLSESAVKMRLARARRRMEIMYQRRYPAATWMVEREATTLA